jgi:hypothetical protein
VNLSSVRTIFRLIAAALLLFTVCLAVTPTRVQRWAERFPGHTFLESPDNEMAEYGFRHTIPGVGWIKSRFTAEELKSKDATRWAEVVAIIDRYPFDKYAKFINDYPSQRTPFIHEARVHVQSVGWHLRKREEYPEGSEKFIIQSTIALRQHQILETYFTHTIENSVHRLSAERLEELRELQLPNYLWESRTSRHLITWISERTLRKMLLGLIVALIVLDASFGVRLRSKPHRQGGGS